MLGSLPLFGIGGWLYARLGESSWFEVTKKKLSIPGLPQPLRILHLSDFHASPEFTLSQIEKAIDLALEQEADMALLTGDYITNELEHEAEYVRVLQKLSDRMPTFACVGNHDGALYKPAAIRNDYKEAAPIRRLLRASGVRELFNEKIITRIKNQEVAIVGLGDYWSGDCDPTNVLFKKRKEDVPTFVLSHNPDTKEILRKYDWDLLCCGHTHGGQLVIPFLQLRPILPVVDKSFPEGLLSWEKKHVHVTRGIGNLHGLRFNCRPEISLLDVS